MSDAATAAPYSLRLDVVAGLTAAAVVLPKAMAYATVAGLPVAVGLAAGAVFLSRSWDDLGHGARLAVAGSAAAVFLVAGFAIHRRAEPAVQRVVARPGAERVVDIEDREIEVQRRMIGQPVLGPDTERGRAPVHERERIAVREHHALGLAGRARRVENVGQREKREEGPRAQ